MRNPGGPIEILEARVAPATILNPRTVTYTDIDGDHVRITFSKNVFTAPSAAANLVLANLVFKFDGGEFGEDDSAGWQLQLIDFTKFPVIANSGSTVNGVGITVTATQAGSGNGFADVGAIRALGVSLGKVTIDGDLGQIDAGGSGLKIGVAGLTVDSIGQRGIGTQIPVPSPTAENPAPDLVSTIIGELSFLKVAGDIKEARIRVVDGTNIANQITTIAKIGAVTVGGSLIGRTAAEAASDDTGTIESGRDIGAVIIGTNLADGIVGGGGVNSGRINAGGKIASLKISGSISGGAGVASGTVTTNNSVGAISVGGGITGGAGDGSGLIRIYGNVASFTLGNDLVAGAGPDSGSMKALGEIKTVLIKGDIDGVGTAPVPGAGAGSLFANGLPKVTVNGSVIGGDGARTGSIESGRDLGTITVLGNVTGGGGNGSGSIVAQGAAKSLTIKGNLLGGQGHQSGWLRSGMDMVQSGAMGTVIIGGKVEGGGGNDSGAIQAGGTLKSVTIYKKTNEPLADVLKGGGGAYSGSISAAGTVSTVKIFGHVQGGGGKLSGSISALERTAGDHEFAGNLGTITVNGRLAGGGGEKSGYVQAEGAIKQLTVAALQGGTGPGSGGVRTGDGLLGTGDVASLRILGDLAQAATTPGAGSASILVGGKLKKLSVNGAITGATIRAAETIGTLTALGNVTNTTVSALGQAVPSAKADLAISKLDLRQNVSGSSFLAGYNLTSAAANPDAQIGTVAVKGNWTASSLVAGVVVGGDEGFGNELDAKAPGSDNPKIVSKIASITIGGSVTGNGTDHFGFVAQLIAKAKFGTTKYALNGLADGQVFTVAEKVTIREIAV